MSASELNNNSRLNNNSNGDDDDDSHDEQEDRNHDEDMKKRPSKASAREGNETATDDSCSSSTEMASSAHMTTTMTVSSDGSHCHDAHANVVTDADTRREQLYQQTIIMAILTTVSFAVAILTIIPLTTVMALTALATSGGLLSYVTAYRLLFEYQQMVAGDGLVQFLPASWVQQLTEMSLHQFLRDDTFVREWGFMAIYFVPGLSEEQLNNYIRRLAPEQRNFLHRHGLGHMVGDRFMRVLMGENRLRRQATTLVGNTIEHPNTRALVVPTTTTTNSRAIGFEQPPGVVELTVPTTTITTTSTTRSILPLQGDEGDSSSDNDDDENDNTADDDGDAGSDLIMAAFNDAMWEYARWAGAAAFLLTHHFIIEPALMISGSMGLGVSFLTLGAGLWQYSNRPTSAIQSSQPSSFFVSAPFLIGTGIMGGVAAGTMIYARTAIRRFVEDGPTIKTMDPSPPKKKKKKKGGRDD